MFSNLKIGLIVGSITLLLSLMYYYHSTIMHLEGTIKELQADVLQLRLDLSNVNLEKDRYKVALDKQTGELQRIIVDKDNALRLYNEELNKPERFRVVQEKVYINTEGKHGCDKLQAINNNVFNMDWNNF